MPLEKKVGGDGTNPFKGENALIFRPRGTKQEHQTVSKKGSQATYSRGARRTCSQTGARKKWKEKSKGGGKVERRGEEIDTMYKWELLPGPVGCRG